MNIAFFGTSDRSIPILESLKKAGQLNFIVTKADVLFGRKQLKKELKVKTWAKENSVEFFEISELKKDMDLLVKTLIKNNIQLGVMADFSFIIPQNLIDSIPHGILNIHFSLLPKYRGASPVQFAILNGDEQTGITFYLMDKGMDTGKILHQVAYKLHKNSENVTTYEDLFNLAANEVPFVIKSYLKKEIKPKTQNSSEATYTTSPSNQKTTTVQKADAKINWEKDIDFIERQIRAYSGWPVCYTSLEDLENNRKITANIIIKDSSKKKSVIKIHKAELVGKKINPLVVQVEGKSKTDWKSFINGYAVVSKEA